MDFDLSSIRSDANLNTTLRAHVSKVYNYMAGALAVSGFSAYLASQHIANNPLYTIQEGVLQTSLLGWVVVLATFVLIWMINASAHKLNYTKAQVCFWLFAVLMGLSSAPLFLVYANTQLAHAFLITAGSFYGLHLYAQHTKKDLSQIGSFCIMGLIGIILISIMNIFIQSSFLLNAVCVAGVAIFAGLTAYDAQQIKNSFYENESNRVALNCAAITSALALYLDFINLFRFILVLLNDRK